MMLACLLPLSSSLMALRASHQLVQGACDMPVIMPRIHRSPKMQYGQQSHAEQGYAHESARQVYAKQGNDIHQVVWTLAGVVGVTGFSGVANDQISGKKKYTQQDYSYLPYALCNGDTHVLSRWNMIKQKLTVSRMQCKVDVAADGTATLISLGRGATMWRDRSAAQEQVSPENLSCLLYAAEWPRGPWNGLTKGETRVLRDGDQISLDANDPDAAVFTCQSSAMLGDDAQQDYMQHGYTQQPAHNEQPGHAQGLPAGWSTAVDEASGVPYYYNEHTGISYWEPPMH